MHISFAVFADAANLSQEGKLNVLGVFDAVQVAGLPTIHPRTHFIVRVKADGSDVGTHKLTFRWSARRRRSCGRRQANSTSRPRQIPSSRLICRSSRSSI